MSYELKLVGILFFLLYLYSGIESFTKLNEKVKNLKKKYLFQNRSEEVLKSLIIIVNVLLILFSVCAMIRSVYRLPDWLTNLTFIYLSLFMVSVTLIYYYNKPIPALTNLSLLCGILYIYFNQTA